MRDSRYEPPDIISPNALRILKAFLKNVITNKIQCEIKILDGLLCINRSTKEGAGQTVPCQSYFLWAKPKANNKQIFCGS